MKAITVPYAYALRNLISNEEYFRQFDVMFVYDVDEVAEILKSKGLGKGLKLYPLSQANSNKRAAIAFNLLAIGMMETLNLQSYSLKKRFNRVRRFPKFICFILEFLFNIFEKEKRFYKVIDFLCFSDSKVLKTFKSMGIDELTVTCGHMRHEYAYLSAAKKLNVFTSSLVFSWDVVTTKGSYLYSVDRYDVWGWITVKELERIHRFLLNRNFKTRIVKNPIKNSLPNDYEVDRSTKIDIFYTATVPRLFKNELPLIEKICKYAKSRSLSLLIRVHPQEPDISRYHNIINMYPEVSFFFPGEVSDISLDQVKLKDDFFQTYVKQLQSASVIIGVASTTLLDAICFDKSYICIGFDELDSFEDFKIKSYYEYEHFSKLLYILNQSVVSTFSDLVDEIETKIDVNPNYNVYQKSAYGIN